MNLTLTIEEANLVLAGLLELPAKMSMQLIQKIHQQAQEQQADIDDAQRDQEADQVSEPLQLEDVVAASQTNTQPVQASQFGSLFPNDTLGQAIVDRNRRG